MAHELRGSTRVYTTSQLAERLGVSANMARRYGLTWEKVTGDMLPQEPGRGRMYHQGCLDALEASRAWLIQHPAESIETALRVTLGLEAEPPGEPKVVPGTLTRDDVNAAVREALAETLAPLMAQLQAVRAENAELRTKLEALPAPGEGSEVTIRAALEAALQEHLTQIKVLIPTSDTPPSDKAAYVAEMEQIHTDEELEEERRRVRELNRRIEYLHQELVRRNSQAQPVRRPWWKLWGKK